MRSVLLVSYLCCASLFAKEQPPSTPPPSRVYFGLAAGYSLISGARGSEGQTPQGRFTIGVDAWTYSRCTFGFEGGLQSGNTMRLDVSQSFLDVTGGLPPATTLKPLLDFLGTFRCTFPRDPKAAFLLKIGPAYRSLQFNDRTSSTESIHRINPELQAGFSYQLTGHARITLFYQLIYSGSTADLKLAPNDDVLLGQIPTQQGGFVGVEYAL